MNKEENLEYNGHVFKLVETKDYRWHAFHNDKFLSESFSRRRAIEAAIEAIDRLEPIRYRVNELLS